MKQLCKFCKKRDFKESAPNLSVNLSRAMEEKVVPSSGQTLESNEMPTTNAIGGRVRDNFEAIEAQRAMTAYGKSKAAEAKAEAAAKAAAEAAAAASKSTDGSGA